MQRPPTPTPYWLRAASGRSLLGLSGLPCVLVKHAPSGRENPPGAWQSRNSKLLASMGRVLRRSDGAVTASAMPTFRISKTGLDAYLL